MNKRLQYLTSLFQITYIPIQYYKNGLKHLTLPNSSVISLLNQNALSQLLNDNKEISYFVSKDYLYYGIVRNIKRNEYVVIGPITNIHLDANSILSIMMDNSIPSDKFELVKEFFEVNPLVSFSQFINFLAILQKEILGTISNPNEQFYLQHIQNCKDVSASHITQLYNIKESEHFHNTHNYEQELLRCISEGNMRALTNQINKTQLLIPGKIGFNSLRQTQNIFITSITLFTRAAIKGGLDMETAYQLSDAYIQESEKAQSPDSIQRLTITALFDFTNRVSDSKIPTGMSSIIYDCLTYISNHTNQHISLNDIAEYIGKSPSYVSRKFKEELGFNINEFIIRKKLEEAKSLLEFTDKTIAEISEYLCFSSQSYFQNLFKKQYNTTPLKFRREKNPHYNH